jgi:hypothetical protein
LETFRCQTARGTAVPNSSASGTTLSTVQCFSQVCVPHFARRIARIQRLSFVLRPFQRMTCAPSSRHAPTSRPRSIPDSPVPILYRALPTARAEFTPTTRRRMTLTTSSDVLERASTTDARCARVHAAQCVTTTPRGTWNQGRWVD